MAVAIGDYDAGFICAEEGPEEDMDAGSEQGPVKNLDRPRGVLDRFKEQTRVVALTDPAPGWLFTVPKAMKAEMAKRVRGAVLRLKPFSPEAGAILARTPWIGFVPATGEEMEEMERLAARYGVPH